MEPLSDMSRLLLEAGGRQDVHVSGFELVWPGSLPPTLHGGDLHLGWSRRLSGGIVSQSCGLRLHHLHGSRLLGAAVRLQREARWVERRGNHFSLATTQQAARGRKESDF